MKLSIAAVLVRKLAAMLTVTASPHYIHNKIAYPYINRITLAQLYMYQLFVFLGLGRVGQSRAGQGREGLLPHDRCDTSM